MILNFSVKNFLSIKDWVNLSFEASDSKDLEDYYIINPGDKKNTRVLKLGLIYGANASGKTNILKALDFLRDLVNMPVAKKSDTLQLNNFKFDDISIHENTFFKLEFFESGIKYLYELELNSKAIVNEILYFFDPNKAIVFDRTTDISKQLTSITFGKKIKLKQQVKQALQINTLWNNTVLGAYSKINAEIPILDELQNWFLSALLPMVTLNTNLYEFVTERVERKVIDKHSLIQTLNKADFNISDLTFRKEKRGIDAGIISVIKMINPEMDTEKSIENNEIELTNLILHHRIGDKSYPLEYEFESSGTQRYYQLSGLLSLMISGSVILPIDELESALHPDLLKHFLLTFLVNGKNSQLIATTHFRELLMERDIFRNDVIWFTEKKEDGSTELFSLEDFDSSVVRTGSSIYNAYKVGKLGATPNLSDYYIPEDIYE